MVQFTKTDTPRVYPKACIACSSTSGPFVDTAVEKHGWGRVYWCEKCHRAGSKALGWPLPEQAAKLTGERDGLRLRVAELEEKLAEADANRVVPLADVAAALRRSQQKTAAAEKASG